MIVLFVNPKKPNRVNYKASISEDENKVAKALLNTVCAAKYSLAVYMWLVSPARGLMEIEGTLWSVYFRVCTQYYFLSNRSTKAGQLSQKPGTDVRLQADAGRAQCQFMSIRF